MILAIGIAVGFLLGGTVCAVIGFWQSAKQQAGSHLQ